jgi:hypothetical protein
MREPPAAEPARDRGDHPRRLRLLQQPPRVQAAGGLEHAQLEVAPDHRGDLEDPLAVAGQAREPLGDHRLDALRQPPPSIPAPPATESSRPWLASRQTTSATNNGLPSVCW